MLEKRFKHLNTYLNIWIQDDIIVVIYVNNLSVVGLKFNTINSVKLELFRFSQMTDLKDPIFYLGMSFTLDRAAQGLGYSLETYIRKIVWDHWRANWRPKSTPMLANNHLKQVKEWHNESSGFQTEYPSIIGSFVYAIWNLGATLLL